MAVLINGQKAYGKNASIADTFAYFKHKLEKRFTGNQVLHALDIYTDQENDVPAPADIIAILAPPEVKISTAEFIHAKERHAQEGFPMYGYYGQIVKDYERQNAEDRGNKQDGPIHPKLAARLDAELKKIAAE